MEGIAFQVDLFLTWNKIGLAPPSCTERLLSCNLSYFSLNGLSAQHQQQELTQMYNLLLITTQVAANWCAITDNVLQLITLLHLV